MRRIVTTALVLFAATPASLLAQVGSWQVPPGGYIDQENVVAASAEAAAVARIDALIGMLRRVPVLVRPAGADIVTLRIVEHYPLAEPRPRGDMVRYGLRAMFHMLHPDGTRDTHYQGVIEIDINPAPDLLPWMQRAARDGDGVMYRHRPSTGTHAGWPLWGESPSGAAWEQVVVIGPRNGAPVLAPVTRDRWLRHRLSEATGATTGFGSADERCLKWRAEAPQRAEALRAAVAAIRASDPAAAARMQEDMARIERETEAAMCAPGSDVAVAAGRIAAREDSLRREHAALLPQDRQAPAWLDAQDRFQAPGTPATTPLVAFNAALFPAGLGAQPHVIVVRMRASRPMMIPILQQAWRELDWDALVAMIR